MAPDADQAFGGLSLAFKTLGCKVNRVESDAIAAELLAAGGRLVDESAADVIVVNTCTVTGEADAKARKAVRHALSLPNGPVVVVTGCLAALDAEGLRSLGDKVVVEADKGAVARRVGALVGRSRAAEPAVEAFGDGFRTRALLKIEDGCDAYCAYCIVPYARGVPRAVPLAEVRAHASGLVAAGAREIVLTGINLGRYADHGADLADVVVAVAETGVQRLRLSSIEPLDLNERLLGVLADTPAVCPHVHVPLQSGSDAVLGAMGRGYTTATYRERVEAARAAMPEVAVTTDVVTGFPGETGRDAADTLAFCESVGFARMHVFRYSVRAGTRAADMPDQVSAEEKSERASALRDLSARLWFAYAREREGDRAQVLVERIDGGVAEGTTPDYLRVRFPASAQLATGDVAEVVLGEASDERVAGRLVVDESRSGSADSGASRAPRC